MPGQGHHYWLTMPCIHMTNVQVADYKKQQLNQKAKYTHLQEQPKVMVVDDIFLNRRLLCTGLKDHYPHPTQFKNGELAVQTYKTQAVENADMIIFMDINMPVMDGREATKAIRDYEKQQGLPPAIIIAVTGNNTAAERKLALEAGVDAFAAKPVQSPDLLKMVEQVYVQRQHQSSIGAQLLAAKEQMTALCRKLQASSEPPLKFKLEEVGCLINISCDGLTGYIAEAVLAQLRQDLCAIPVFQTLLPSLNGEQLCLQMATAAAARAVYVFLSTSGLPQAGLEQAPLSRPRTMSWS